MSRIRNWISRAMMLIVCVSMGAMIWGTAFGQESSGDQGTSKKYILRASGTWGAAQDQAVLAAGGTVTFSHGPSGLAVAISDRLDFLSQIKKSGAIGGGAEDVVVRWQDPNERVGDEALTPDAV